MATTEFPYPLKSWTLKGFRAIRDETTFKLGGLNVLVGANSAGKSSVLHSLLLTAQTLATPMADRPLVLNGNHVRLGLAGDCVHEETDREIKIAFVIDPKEVDFGRPVMNDVTQVSVQTRFTVDQGDANFKLARSDFSAHFIEEPGKAQISIWPRTPKETEEALIQSGASPELAAEYVNGIGIGVSGDIPEGTVGAYPRQFLPNTLAVLANGYIRELEDFLRLWRARATMRPTVGPLRRQSAASEPVARIIHEFINEMFDPSLASQLPPVDHMTPESLSAFSEEIQEDIRLLPRTTWFAEHVKKLPFKGELENPIMISVLDAGVDYVRWWFSRSVRHLGPLRAAPQPLYGLPEAASGASVGPSGEYTAAVLSSYGSRLAPVPMPNGKIESVRLSRAVDQWVNKLGLLAAVHPKERGKLGYELNVSIQGVKRPLDLTTVGVGVSQALPIIVLGLIAEPGSLLLFEQPELHLHPNVQAALGDFFLALARSGRQLIIETHSEYLITRLRRRQITDSEPDAAQLTRLFFFERDGSAAKVQPTRIEADGSMPDWPKGFLDTTAREVEAMVLRDSG